jgi:hypothetical protein
LTSALPSAASSVANLLPPWMPLSTQLRSALAPASESNEEPGTAAVQNEMAALREEVSKLKAQSNSAVPRRAKSKRVSPMPAPPRIRPSKDKDAAAGTS